MTQKHTPVTDQVRESQGDYLVAVEDLESSHADLLAALKLALKASDCPCCDRDNRGYEEDGCTSDDCPGAAAIANASPQAR